MNKHTRWLLKLYREKKAAMGVAYARPWMQKRLPGEGLPLRRSTGRAKRWRSPDGVVGVAGG
jgi:hypothetical protein